jgi:hypothetical protein
MRAVRLGDEQPGANHPPTRDVQRRHVVRVPSEGTRHTAKCSPVEPVPAVSMAAGGTGLTGVSGIDDKNGHSSGLSLVLDERAQLKEPPAAEQSSLIPGDLPRQAAGDAVEVFNCKGAIVEEGSGDEPFRHDVIYVALKASLLVPPGTQPAAGRMSALGLEPSAQTVVPPAQAIDVRPGLLVPVAVDRQIDEAHVHAQYPAVRGDGRRIRQRHGDMQPPSPLVISQQIALPDAAGLSQHRPLIAPGAGLAHDPPDHRRERHPLVASRLLPGCLRLETKQACVVDHCPICPEAVAFPWFTPVGVRHHANGPHHELGLDGSELPPGLVVRPVVKGHRPPNALGVCHAAGPVANRAECSGGARELLGVRQCRPDGQHDGALHVREVYLTGARRHEQVIDGCPPRPGPWPSGFNGRVQ